MNDKSLEILEYNKITDLLSSFASSSSGKILCSALKPMTNKSDIIQAQNETRDANNRIRLFNTTTFFINPELSSSVDSLKFSQTLSIKELSNIMKMLNNIKNLKIYSNKLENEDSLSPYFNELYTLSDLFSSLNHAIYDENNLNDNASHELSIIRSQIKHCNDKIQSRLNNMLHSYSDMLMEPVIVLRNNSHCIPVRAEYKKKISGIVHDQSNGGATYFIEPIEIVNLNNEIRQLNEKEFDEIQNIIRELSAVCESYSFELKRNCSLLSHLDFVFAKGKFANKLKAEMPVFNDEFYINLKSAIHPLLDMEKAVPIDISIGKNYKQLIITGPNTGGKTVSLKTVGLLCAMGQSGLFIPAFYGSSLPIFKDIFVDIGDEQSIEQSLSTFSGHIKRIAYILKYADKNSLCLFDEIGAGTDPLEGAALANSILEYLLNNDITTMATTHYSEIKEYAINTDGVENASLEFDINTLMPTFKIITGIAGKSNAFAISEKLGLPIDIINNAKSKMDKNAVEFDKLLSKLEKEQKEIEVLKNSIMLEKAEIDKIKSKFVLDEQKLTERKNKIINEAKEQANDILYKAKETADSSIRSIQQIASNAGLGAELEKQREMIRQGIKSNEVNKIQSKTKNDKIVNKNEISIGDKVFIHSMNIEAEISSLPNEKNLLFVNIGALKTQVKVSDISIISSGKIKEKDEKKYRTIAKSFNKAMNISPEINLIGLNVSDACEELDKYLDDAVLSGLGKVKIIHGRGTKALQKGIHNYLRGKKFIKHFALADFNDGGEAITIVDL